MFFKNDFLSYLQDLTWITASRLTRTLYYLHKPNYSESSRIATLHLEHQIKKIATAKPRALNIHFILPWSKWHFPDSSRLSGFCQCHDSCVRSSHWPLHCFFPVVFPSVRIHIWGLFFYFPPSQEFFWEVGGVYALKHCSAATASRRLKEALDSPFPAEQFPCPSTPKDIVLFFLDLLVYELY